MKKSIAKNYVYNFARNFEIAYDADDADEIAKNMKDNLIEYRKQIIELSEKDKKLRDLYLKRLVNASTNMSSSFSWQHTCWHNDSLSLSSAAFKANPQ